MIKNYKQVVLLCILSTFLFSCQSYVIPKQDTNPVENNKKALVILGAKIISVYPKKTESPTYLVWRNTQKKNTNRILWSAEPKNYAGYALCSYVLEPGEYTIKEITTVKNDFDGTTVTTLYVNDLAKFSVKGGEVIYLGNITFYRYKEQITYKITDNYNQVYNETQKLFPSLQARLIKRLLNN